MNGYSIFIVYWLFIVYWHEIILLDTDDIDDGDNSRHDREGYYYSSVRTIHLNR